MEVQEKPVRTTKQLAELTEKICHEHRKIQLQTTKKVYALDHEINVIEAEKKRLRKESMEDRQALVLQYCKENNMSSKRIFQILNTSSNE